MGNTSVVVGKIVAMFLVMLVGVLARRRSLVDAKTTSILSRLTTDLALPALIFTQMLATVDAPGAAGELGGAGADDRGAVSRPAYRMGGVETVCHPGPGADVHLRGGDGQLDLPAAADRGGAVRKRGDPDHPSVQCGSDGVPVDGGRGDVARGTAGSGGAVQPVKNPGLIATVLGIALALLGPHVDVSAGVKAGLRPGLEALAMIGQLTIPLSLLVTGMQLGAMATFGAHVPVRALAGVTVLRLVVVPLVAAGLAWGMQRCGCSVPDLVLAVCFLIATMPVGVSCSILAERFRQDGRWRRRAFCIRRC